jgi:hypothetical protein
MANDVCVSISMVEGNFTGKKPHWRISKTRG